MLNIQKTILYHLSGGKKLDQILTLLENELGLKIQQCDHYIGLNYDQIESPKSHPVVMECRALTLCRHTFSPVSRAFDRFFNWGEMPDYYNDFDISTAVVMEKCDGSLLRVWWNCWKNQWEIGTRSMYYGDGDHIIGVRFRDLALEFLGVTEEQFQEIFLENAQKNKTYIFEMIGPRNRVVTRYKKEEWVITGIRNNESGEYDNMNEMKNFVQKLKAYTDKIRLVEVVPLNSFDKIVEVTKSLSDLQEGFVAWCQKTHKRIKIKSPVYVAVHGIRENGVISRKRALTLVLMNEHEEYLSYFEEDRAFFEPLVQEVQDFIADVQQIWEGARNIRDQKEFALRVKDHRASGLIFETRKRNGEIEHVFNSMDMNKKLRLFGF